MPRRPPGMHRHAGSGFARGFRVYAIPRPEAESYQMTQRTGLDGVSGSATVIGAGAVVQLGPSGWGTRWYLTQASVSTTTGPNDSSTVALYLGAQVQANLLGGGSFAGGQDSIGLNVRPLMPGDFINAVWSGANNGDIATLVLYGEQDALTSW